MLSCGAALHHCIIGLAASGWQATVHRLPNPAQPDHLAALKVHQHRAGQLDIQLAAAIPQRRTDRRHYSWWPVSVADLQVISARAARAGLILRRLESLPALRYLVAQAAWRHQTDADYQSELRAWSGRHAAPAGVPARNTPEPDPAAPIPARRFAEAALAQPHGAEAEDDNAVVLALGTAEDTALSRLCAGEAISMVLLTATAMGLASCPITEPLEVPETRDAVRDDVFGGNGFPQMLVRIGWAPIGADPLPAAPRRPLSEVAEWLGGSPLA